MESTSIKIYFLKCHLLKFSILGAHVSLSNIYMGIIDSIIYCSNILVIHDRNICKAQLRTLGATLFVVQGRGPPWHLGTPWPLPLFWATLLCSAPLLCPAVILEQVNQEKKPAKTTQHLFGFVFKKH